MLNQHTSLTGANFILNNTNVCVIGGSSGIGRSIADCLARSGARVIVLSRTKPEQLDNQEAAMLEWQYLDLSDVENSKLQLNNALDKLNQKVDVVVYSAIYYGNKRSSFLSIEEKEWKQQLNVNLNGLWLTLSKTLSLLQRSNPGLFIHISSEVAYNAGPWRSGYAATKAAASNLIYSIAQEDGAGLVRMVQLMPAKMVDTKGIRKRRPDNFDYSEYMKPEIFQDFTLQLVVTRGAGWHGESVVLDETGKPLPISDNIPFSQSFRGIKCTV